MPKIIKITKQKVYIGLDNGDIKEVKKEELNFEPQLNDEVNIYENKNMTIISKKEKKVEDYIKKEINNSINNIKSDVNETKKVNKTIYAILTILLGWAGIHKFYADKFFLGLLYFIFSWTFIPFILSILEFIKIIYQTPDKNGEILV